MYVYASECIHIYLYIHITDMILIQAPILSMYKNAYAYTLMYTYIYIYIYIYIYVYKCIHMHIYACICKGNFYQFIIHAFFYLDMHCFPHTYEDDYSIIIFLRMCELYINTRSRTHLCWDPISRKYG
jgi:hypothetical protein